ncbi:transcriptional regulator, GntR family [Dethiosulfatibacter aminovorans DSM 17477]|uniref:Transcriptional regulator, GntR family n=1 Tax=Dethiosulfatibacter aminovorans DSM 17477 TaxID=1121476 RepID=A0A1M6C4D2_9FIRM|nr:GntR family transcriptional regulator [Dethiosulfatibacter aminovorans]SHI55813.1 transcriptional regulator, GntR family [Dethiosulfatibacter aminovorans DSM 17477]
MVVTKSLQLVVFEHLRDKIINGELSDNEIYSETKLAKDLGVSRTPVRDAIHRLSQEGYIDILPSKGFKLHKMSVKDIEEIFQVRSAIESYCTLYIAKRYDEDKAKALFKELDRLNKLMDNIVNSSRNIDRFIKYDFHFHMSIVEYADNSVFKNIFETYTYRIQKLAKLSLGHENRMENTCKEHSDILEAMKRGDIDEIYDITMVHMETPKYINLKDLENL